MTCGCEHNNVLSGSTKRENSFTNLHFSSTLLHVVIYILLATITTPTSRTLLLSERNTERVCTIICPTIMLASYRSEGHNLEILQEKFPQSGQQHTVQFTVKQFNTCHLFTWCLSVHRHNEGTQIIRTATQYLRAGEALKSWQRPSQIPSAFYITKLAKRGGPVTRNNSQHATFVQWNTISWRNRVARWHKTSGCVEYLQEIFIKIKYDWQ